MKHLNRAEDPCEAGRENEADKQERPELDRV